MKKMIAMALISALALPGVAMGAAQLPSSEKMLNDYSRYAVVYTSDEERVYVDTETIERDPLFLRAPRVVIPASINALHFYQELGYAFAPGGDRLDEEQLYCLEKFPQRSM